MFGQLRDPFHRVDVHESSRPVTVSADGRVVARSERPKLLFETGLPRARLPPVARMSSQACSATRRSAPPARTRATRATCRSRGSRTRRGPSTHRCRMRSRSRVTSASTPSVSPSSSVSRARSFPAAEPVGVERRRVDDRRLAGVELRDRRPVTGPSATPAPSWPVASQTPGDRARRADRRQAVGQPGAQAGPGGRDRQRREAREQPRRARDERIAHRGVDRRVEAAPLARGADQHVALPRRLDDGRELERRGRARDRAQVGAVDDLVADQAGRGRGEPHELALARLERERRGRRRRRAGRSTGRPRSRRPAPAGSSPPATTPIARPGPASTIASTAQPSRTVAPACAGLARQRPRDRARVALEVAGEQARAVQLAGQLGLQLAHLAGADQPRARRPRSAPAAPARPPRSPRPCARSARPCGGSAPRRRAAPPARRRAPARRASAPAPGRRPCRSTARCPRPAPVVPLDTAPRSSSVTVDAAHRQLARDRRADDPGADDDDVGHSEKPAGNGSSASSRYWPIAVIHARPVISGTIAGRPPTVVSSAIAPGEARADHRLVDEAVADRQLAARVQLREPRATCRSRTASGRASRGGSRSPRARRRRRGRARGRRRAGSPRCAGPPGGPGGRPRRSPR